ncbi:MAG: hypothetical protein ABSG17_13950 [Spirochaetia bacterium]|jgi:hypothetical protein
MRTRVVLISAVLLLGAAAVIVLLRMAEFDTTLEFSFQDSVSKQWVWDSAARVQDRLIRSFYQSDAGPVPFIFSHLKPGPSTLEISAPGYLPVSIPLKLHRGSNRLEKPIEMKGYEIPNLQSFVVFERLDGGDLVCQIRPVGNDGHAVTNHPCLPLWVECRVTVQLKDGRPVTEPTETRSTQGEELFRGSVPWEWNPTPETVFRYSARIPGSRIKPDPAPYRVVDYLIVIPDPRRMDVGELDALMKSAPALPDVGGLKAYLDGQGKKLRYFFDTSWNVQGTEQ